MTVTGQGEVLRAVAQYLERRRLDHPVRVGIDGICGAGKTTFAAHLAEELGRLGRAVVLLDSDGFHHVRDRRRQQGRDSARGYYEDGYDFEALASRVLRPLGPGGDRVHARAVHDLATDAVVVDETALAPPDAVVLFAATFLQRDGLRDLWDEVIYLHADEPVAMQRGIARDAVALGGHDAAADAYENRYLAACRLYLAEQDPRSRASVVVDNTDLDRPVLDRLGLLP